VIELALSLPLAGFALNVALQLRAAAVAVLGPSGSGKTSLLEAIAGLRPQARGRIALGARVLLDTATRVRLPPERRRVGYVPQDSLLFPHLTVDGNVRFGMGAGPEARRAREDAVALLDIGPLLPRFPSTLSGGERQRVALARALCTAPELLLLDEPLASLDVELKERILPYLLRIRDEARVPMLYVTHHAGEARLLAQEAVLLERGEVKAHGPAADLLRPTAPGLDPRESWENAVDGLLESPASAQGAWTLVSGPVRLSVPSSPDLRAGARAAYAVAAEDVLISTGPLPGLSARNVFPASVVAVEPIGPDAMVRLSAGGLEWHARLTAPAAEELRLAAEMQVFVAIKTHSLRKL
jgi:molybdate transport system ATP-binding protein